MLRGAMAEANIDLVRSIYERWLRDDYTFLEDVDEGLELHPDPAAYWVGVNDIYRGHDGLRLYMSKVYEAFEDYRPEIEGFLPAGDKVVTLAIETGRGRASGALVESRRTAHVWTIEDGKATRLDLYLEREPALRAAGLRPD
jgi:ketosteroid isomerase-like protein